MTLPNRVREGGNCKEGSSALGISKISTGGEENGGEEGNGGSVGGGLAVGELSDGPSEETANEEPGSMDFTGDGEEKRRSGTKKSEGQNLLMPNDLGDSPVEDLQNEKKKVKTRSQALRVENGEAQTIVNASQVENGGEAVTVPVASWPWRIFPS
ncbi:hypothetical protein NE237_009219 [Protea cynaroides]|uniref:Uncharacterized protein n=1 Tax=Protea cynaroides TaxID=273540 RepID=A0A9Q0KXI2_9MAGN|nr:hypothetical protein NE237_009219 [Protea cynaroides]